MSSRPSVAALTKVAVLRVRLSEYPTYAPLGEFDMPVAMRATVSGNMEAPATVFWNVKKAN
jgi:peptide/nickel transport system substrate-binding protein